jgi:hypothetical protein
MPTRAPIGGAFEAQEIDMALTPWRGLPKERRPQDIAQLNDWLRNHLTEPGHNRVVMTQGIADLIGDTAVFLGFQRQAELLRLVRDYLEFTPNNDPHRERDFGDFTFEETRCFWKIDYFDRTLSAGSKDPADADATVRVLTIMRADEW